MKENNFCIYKHTCKENGKVYIGQTCQNPIKRWNNGNGYKQSIHFYAAIQKYGWDNFEHEILFEGLTQEQANELEKILIKKYNSNNPQYGYNLTDGGKNGRPNEETRKKQSEAHIGKPGYWAGKHRSEEVKEKLRKANLGKHLTPEQIENLRQINKGRKKSAEEIEKIRKAAIGRKPSEETRKKMSEVKKGEKHPNWGKRAAEVPTFGRKLSEEAKKKISKANKGKKRTEEQKEHLRQSKLGEKNPRYGKHITQEERERRSKPVRCIETDIIYYGLREAERQTGINRGGIKRCCNKKQKTAGGFHWEFVEKINNPIDK